jgi:SAM-dependent methyltransferase
MPGSSFGPREWWLVRWVNGLRTLHQEEMDHPTWAAEQFLERFFDCIEPGSSVFDVGCGSGANFFLLGDRVAYYGLDVAGEAVAHVRSLGGSAATFYGWAISHEPDWVVCTGVLMGISRAQIETLLPSMAEQARHGVIFDYDVAEEWIEAEGDPWLRVPLVWVVDTMRGRGFKLARTRVLDDGSQRDVWVRDG